jgi:DNA repair protein RecO
MKNSHARAILLRKYEVQENNCFTIWLTENSEIIKVSIHGAKKITGRFTNIDHLKIYKLELYKSRNYQILKDMEIEKSFPSIESNLEKLQQAMEIIKTLHLFTVHESKIDQLFQQSIAAFELTEQSQSPIISDAFKLKTLYLQGFINEIDQCTHCHEKILLNSAINLEESGEIICENCLTNHPYSKSKKVPFNTAKLSKFIIQNPISKLKNLKLERRELDNFQIFVRELMKIHA